MVKPLVIFTVLILSAAAVLGQPGRDRGAEHTSVESQLQVRDTDAQKRRADLRAAVRARRDGAGQAGDGAAGRHQLSPQERDQLRQQLRQNRRETPRP